MQRTPFGLVSERVRVRVCVCSHPWRERERALGRRADIEQSESARLWLFHREREGNGESVRCESMPCEVPHQRVSWSSSIRSQLPSVSLAPTRSYLVCVFVTYEHTHTQADTRVECRCYCQRKHMLMAPGYSGPGVNTHIAAKSGVHPSKLGGELIKCIVTVCLNYV